MSDLEDDVQDARATGKRKAAALDSDEEADGGGSGAEDAEQQPADEEDEEEEEEDDDEEDEPGEHKRKKKRVKRNRFIDDIADVDDEEEDEEDEDYDEEVGGEFIEDDPEGHRVDIARQMRQRDLREQQMTREEEAEIIERYQRLDRLTNVQAEDEEVLDQHSLLPGPTDPRLWMVRCIAGKEKEIVAQIITKYLHMQMKGAPLNIFSAFCHEVPPNHLGTKREGHIYVEARTANAVQLAIEGLRNVMLSKKPEKVPLNEMPEAIKVREVTAKQDTQPGSWVRVIGRGVYQGDLGQVDYVDASGNMFVRLVPRIDYAELMKRNEDRKNGIKPAPFGGMRNGGRRARAAAFNPEEARNAGQIVETRKGEDNTYAMGNKTYRDGYEIKRFSLKGVQPVPDPPLNEVQFFLSCSSGHEQADETTLLAVAGTQQAKFAVGDLVVVAKGDLTSMQGKVVEIDSANDKVFIMPDLEGFNEKLDFAPSELRKHIAIGARVKIVSGSHHVGDLGVVTHSAEGIAEVLLDATETTIKVLINNLSETTETDSGLQSFGNYTLYQLVQLTDNTVGMIIRIGADAAHVLTPAIAVDAPLRLVRLHEIRKLMERSKRLPAPDANRQRIVANSMVEVVEGPYKGKIGTVVHVAAPHLWVTSPAVTKHAGHFVVLSTLSRLKGVASNGSNVSGMNSLSLNPRSPYPGRGGGGGGGAASALNIMSPTPHGGGRMGPPPNRNGGRGYGDGPSNGGRFGGGGRGRGRGRGFQDSLVGQRVRILKGGHRGYMGVVQQATDAQVRIELDATNKIVSVKRDIVSTETGDGRRGARPSRSGLMLPPRTPSHLPPKTPAYTPNTPAYALNTDTEYAPQTTDLGGDNLPMSTPGAMPFTPYTPGTGLYTPGTQLYTPGTNPGAYTPAAATPGTTMRTPGTMAVPTPGVPGTSATTFGTTPYGSTPYTFKTPGAATPGVGADHGDMEGITADGLQHYVGIQVYVDEEKAVVESVDVDTGEATVAHGEETDTGSVLVTGDSEKKQVPIAQLELVQPSKEDRIRVLRAHNEAAPGEQGSFISLDDCDVFVNLERHGTTAVVSLPRHIIGKVNTA